MDLKTFNFLDKSIVKKITLSSLFLVSFTFCAQSTIQNTKKSVGISSEKSLIKNGDSSNSPIFENILIQAETIPLIEKDKNRYLSKKIEDILQKRGIIKPIPLWV